MVVNHLFYISSQLSTLERKHEEMNKTVTFYFPSRTLGVNGK